jgi:inorganic pyrophosphatase/exopolyphosphatase
MIIVTSYDSPDLDGIACAIAYTEFLNQKGISAKALYFGDLGLEVEFVKNYTHNFAIEKHSGAYEPDFDFVLVDTSDPDAIDPAIPLPKVKEIFDHRQLVFVEKFINATKHIELVGSCATLMAEQFKTAGLIPSKNSAIYLYSAIVSNTINFKNSVTTQRDIDTASWLKEITGLGDDYIRQMFLAKSNISSDNLYEVLFQDFAIKDINGKKVGISQIEMVDVDRMSTDLNSALIETLNRFKYENKLDLLFFTGIDIIKGFNIFYTIDDLSQKVFSQALGIPVITQGYKTASIIMRKQIWPKLEAVIALPSPQNSN